MRQSLVAHHERHPILQSHDSKDLRSALDEAWEVSARNTDGQVATYIPELARADPSHFGIATCDLSGEVHAVGDADVPFTLQSVSKPFLYGLALARFGESRVHARVGVEPTGDAFDAIVRLDEEQHRPHNAMVNAGAVAITGLFVDSARERPVKDLLAGLGAFAGRDSLVVDVPVYLSESGAAHRNRAIAHLLRYFDVLEEPVEETLDLYFHQCAAVVTVRELAVMSATLAGGGKNPVTGVQVLPPEVVGIVLAVLSTCGLYDGSGRFLFDVGLPGKSGVSGGLLAVAPGRLGLAAYSPPLDAGGNSVRAVEAMRFLSARLGLHAFEPRPAERVRAEPRTAMSVEVLERAGLRAGLEHEGSTSGRVATYVPSLAAVDPSLFALAVCTVDGEEFAFGDAQQEFTLQAAANPFGYAYATRELGREAVLARCGVEPSGNPFHAILFDPRTGRPYNPLGNAGAMVMAGLAPGAGDADRLRGLLGFMADAAGVQSLSVDAEMLEEEYNAGDRNRAIASLLRGAGWIADEDSALDLYLQQCCIRADVARLARMGSMLAAGGVQPLTGREVLPPEAVRDTLSVMYACGHHDQSGRVAVSLGLPAKSGISGAIVAIAPGRMGLAAWSPAVNVHGTSDRALAAMETLARELGLGLFGAGVRSS